MRTLLLLLLLAAACSQAAPEADWDRPSEDGPVLVGVVRRPGGQPLADVQVTWHGGFATRWPLGSVRTDDQGRYRIDPVQGSRIKDEETGAWDLYVGVCVGSVEGVNPPEFLPWQDVRVVNRPGVVERLDFEFDPESVPPEVRGG